MDRLVHDVRYAARVLWKDRGFSLTTAATLALCLAANIAIFAIVDSVLLKPLPFSESDRLVRIFNQYLGAGVAIADNGVPDYYDRLTGMPALETLANYRQTGVTLSGRGSSDAERIQSMLVTPSFFAVLRAQAFRGQLLSAEHGEVGHDKVVVLAYGFWQRVFGGRDDALGQDVRLGGEVYRVIGVLPRGFRFIDPEIQVYLPVAYTADERSDERRHSNSWQEMGRLKPGATIAQAQAQVDAINAANLDRFPKMKEILINARFGTLVTNLHDNLVAETRPTLNILWGGALVVLLIGCVNVANLVLVRATGRQRELATRQALGASFNRLARQSITESLLLTALGGAAGLGLGYWAIQAAPYLGFDQLPAATEIQVDGRVVAFTLLLVALVGMAMGLLPILAMRRANLAQAVRDEGRSGTQGRGARMLRRALVTCQVSFALVLLIGAGVMLASFQRVLRIDPGFRSANVLTGTVSLPAARYNKDDALRAVTSRLLERVRAIPGVEAAGVTSTLPFGGNYSDSVILAEGYQMSPGESLISPSNVRVSEGYFETMGVTLLQGRFFTPGDAEGRQRVTVIDDKLARRFWPKGDAVGKRMYFPDSAEDVIKKPTEDKMITIVGVIAPMRIRGLVDSSGSQRIGAYYLPYPQDPSRTLGLAIRTAGAPDAVAAAVRREIAQIDPELPLYGVRTMEDRLSESVVDRRTPMLLATGFAAVALVLAAIGIYGVLAYQVSQRRREIGIRMALGADSGSVVGLVLREGALIVLMGAGFGLLGAFLLRQTLQAQLYETGAMDLRVVASVGAMLAAVTLVACLLPARRAARTDPVIALTDQ